MKRLTFFIFLFIYIFISFFPVSNSFALSPTPTSKIKSSPTPTKSTSDKQIDSLTSKIASRVAELKLVERKGVIGNVTDISNTQITLNSINGKTQFVDVDEFTKFTSSSIKTSFGISDIKKGDTLGVLGLYNKESRRILGRFVDVLILPEVIHGVVQSIDSKNFQFSLASNENRTFTIDVQTSTKSLGFDQEKKELVKFGFSKIETGQSVIAVGFFDKNDKSLLEASRVIILPDVARNPNINVTIKEETPTPSPLPKTFRRTSPTP